MNTPIIPQPQSAHGFQPIGLLSMIRNFFQPLGGMLPLGEAHYRALAESAQIRATNYATRISELEAEIIALKAKKVRKPRAKPTNNDEL